MNLFLEIESEKDRLKHEWNLQLLKNKEKAMNTKCDNCGQSPAYKFEPKFVVGSIDYDYEFLYNKKYNLCDKCKKEFFDRYYVKFSSEWDDE